jgi:hypothetical protein
MKAHYGDKCQCGIDQTMSSLKKKFLLYVHTYSKRVSTMLMVLQWGVIMATFAFQKSIPFWQSSINTGTTSSTSSPTLRTQSLNVPN